MKCFVLGWILSTLAVALLAVLGPLRAQQAPTASVLVAEAYKTAATAGTTSLSATTMLTPAGADMFRFSWYITQTVVGTSCTGNTTVVVNVIYQDPSAASAQTVLLATHTVTTNGTLGNVPWTSGPISYTFRAKAATAIQYSTTYTLGTACSPGPTVQLFPVLESL